ncbi:hypothetical protein A2U01_0064078, partial [Trifolium medium]|nr:hypothetical protein [Trifolium medium]
MFVLVVSWSLQRIVSFPVVSRFSPIPTMLIARARMVPAMLIVKKIIPRDRKSICFGIGIDISISTCDLHLPLGT